MRSSMSVAAVLVAFVFGSGDARADFVSSLSPALVGAPDSRAFSNSTSTGSLTSVGTVESGLLYNFRDSWSFTLGPDANAGGFVGTFNFTGSGGVVTAGIDNLQLRLRDVGNTFNIVGWQSGSMFPGFQQVISLISPTPLGAGNYVLEVRGLIVGSPASYGGTLQTSPVPLPPSFALLASGLLAAVWLSRRRSPRN